MSSATSTYHFKVLDFLLCNTGYLMKVACPAPASVSYQLVYVPFARYPSLLMLEYLLAEKKELPSDLQATLIEAIKEDLQRESELGFVILGETNREKDALLFETSAAGMTEQRLGTLPSDITPATRHQGDEVNGLPLQESLLGNRPDPLGIIDEQPLSLAGRNPEAFGTAADEPVLAERPIDQPLKIMRDVYLSKNLIRHLTKLEPGKVAYRLRDHDLVIDYLDEGLRDSSHNAISHRLEQAIRSNQHELLLQRSYTGLREITKPTTTLLHLSSGQREPSHSMQVHQSQQAIRAQVHDLLIGHLTEAARSTGRTMWVVNEQSWARILAHKYPAVLHTTLHQALRYPIRSALIDRERFSGSRYAVWQAQVQTDRLFARRSPLHPLFLVNETVQGRKKSEPRPLWYEHPEQFAVRQALSYLQIDTTHLTAARERPDSFLQILHEHPQGKRLISRPLYRADEWMLAGRTLDNHRLNILQDQWRGERDRLHSLYVPDHLTTAARHLVRPLLVVDSLGRASRSLARSLFVNQERSTAARAVSRPMVLESLSDAIRNISTAAWIIRDQSWGKFKARQYDSTLHVLDQAIRDHYQPLFVNTERSNADRIATRQTWIDSAHPTARRSLEHDMRVIADRTTASRDQTADLTVHESLVQSTRDLVQPARIWQEYLRGRRDERVETYIDKHYEVAVRDNQQPLYLPKDPIEATRSQERDLLLIRQEERGERATGKVLYVPKQMHTGTREAMRNLYIQNVWAAAQRQDQFDADVFRDRNGNSMVIGGGKAPKPSLLPEDEIMAGMDVRGGFFLPDTELLGNYSRIRETLDGLLTDILLFAQRMPEHQADFLEDILALFEWEGELMDDLLVGDRYFDGSSFLEEELFFAGTEARLNAIIESGVIFSTRPNDNPGLLLFDMQGQTEATPAVLEEELLAEDVFRPAILQIENPLGYLEPNPSWLGQELLGDAPPKPSHLGEELLGQTPPKPSHLGEELLGQTPPKPSHLGEELLGQTPPKPSHLGEELLGQTPPKPSHLGEELLGQEPQRPAHLGEELLGQEPQRPGHVNEDWAFDPLIKPSSLEELLLGTLPERPSTLAEVDMLATVPQRLAALATGFIFGKQEERASYITDLYLLAVKSIDEGTLPEEDLPKYAKLALEQGIIGEQMFATEPDRAAHLLEHILSTKLDTRPADLLTPDEWGDLKAAEAVLTELLDGDKQLAEAILLDYQVAIREKSLAGTLDEEMPLSSAALKESFLQQVEHLGQGLLYDYQDELLTQSYTSDEWTDSFARPLDYDPDDPFNPYYPWTDDLEPGHFKQNSWGSFSTSHSPAVWDHDPFMHEWSIQNSSGVEHGMYWNNFEYDDYQFSIKFRIDDIDEDDEGTGVVFRYHGPYSYFMFMINGGVAADSDPLPRQRKQMQLYKVHTQNGRRITEELQPPKAPFPWQPGIWHTITVTVHGNRTIIKVDGITQYDDDIY